jgi:hypothetical protein
MRGEDWVVVYRGFAVPALDLVEAMLQSEGLEPRRLGKASPSLLGVGDWAIEQLIEVPREHEQAALALVAASLQVSSDATQADDLETQALNAPREPPNDAADAKRGGLNVKTIMLIVVVAILLFFWMR